MKIQIALAVLCSTLVCAAAEKYEPTWESLDARPIPQWFADAKFGIFIHWGPYSVPAWAPVGTYSEWYQYWLQNKTCSGNSHPKPTAVSDYHARVYGEDFSYYRFGEMFKAQDFDPAAWAELFAQSGARYILLTSKHHDGFCLWPNQHANKAFGRPWNSMDAGPKRDLVGELKAAVEKTPVKFGLYYSLFEWYNPLWKDAAQRGRFVDEHFWPQVKELVTRYQPAVLWADGDWMVDDTVWKSRELLAWLYNESPVKDTIVVNDRWGKNCRLKHGGYPTTEFQSGPSFDKPWEEGRGMGFSFGYNRNEDVQDYNTPQVLIFVLADVVSHGGNLALDIGPDGTGKIPPIMQERLLQIGQWLKVNGEAIYETTPWKTFGEGPTQVKSGAFHDTDTKAYTPDDFRFTAKGSTVYAIGMACPKDGKATIHSLGWSHEGAALPIGSAELLGSAGKVTWTQGADALTLNLPPDAACKYAWVVKLAPAAK